MSYKSPASFCLQLEKNMLISCLITMAQAESLIIAACDDKISRELVE